MSFSAYFSFHKFIIDIKVSCNTDTQRPTQTHTDMHRHKHTHRDTETHRDTQRKTVV